MHRFNWNHLLFCPDGKCGDSMSFQAVNHHLLKHVNICADFQSGMNAWMTILTAWMRFLHLVISTIATGRQSPPTGGPVSAGD